MRVLVVVYVAAGSLWILGSDPIADRFAELTGIARWSVELGKGVLFVAVTALVLQVVLRHRARRLDAARAHREADAGRLADSEARNHLQATALSSTANAVVITRPDGTIEWVNAAFETMSGYPAAVAVGATPRLLKSGAHDEVFFQQLWETLLAGRVWRGQVVNRRNDGERYTVSQTITPVVGADGEVRYFVAMHEDITARIRAEEALEASRLQLQALFDHALDAIVLADDHGRYVAVNPAACQLTGYSREELLGMGPSDLVTDRQQSADVVEQFAEFMDAGASSGTFTLRHKTGHVVQADYRAVSTIQPGVHLSVMRDVTAHHEMLQALTEAEAEFRGLADNAADLVAKLRVDADGRRRVDYANPAAAAILGYPQAQLQRDPDLLFSLLDRRIGDRDDAQDLVPTREEPVTLSTVQVERADGDLVWLEIHARLTDPTNAPVTIQIVARDVTARLEMTRSLERALQDQLAAAEQLRSLNAMKDTFLQNVSHELRTPLTAILGFAYLLADPDHGLSPEDTRGYHERILNNARRLRRLLDDLLDVDRLSRGRIEPVRQPTDLAALIERVLQEIELGDHPVELVGETVTMDLDVPFVERLVANLVHNIVRHTPAGTRIRIQAYATADGAELLIDDDGPGIPEADRQRLAEPFEQGAEMAAAAQPGTGVGLSLVRTVAQLHGGDLTITDSPMGGARMIVTLASPGGTRGGPASR